MAATKRSDVPSSLLTEEQIRKDYTSRTGEDGLGYAGSAPEEAVSAEVTCPPAVGERIRPLEEG